jgi:hypothetical protein
MTHHWWVDEVNVAGRNVRDDRDRRLFGEHDHSVDLSRDGMMTLGLSRCPFDTSRSRQKGLASCIKRKYLFCGFSKYHVLKKTLPHGIILYKGL